MNEAASRKTLAYTQIRVREPAGQRAFEEALGIGGEGAQIVVPGAPAGEMLRVERHGGAWVAVPSAGEVRFNGRPLSAARELHVGDALTVGEAYVGVNDLSRTLLQLEVMHRVGNATITPMGAIAELAGEAEDEEIVIHAASARISMPLAEEPAAASAAAPRAPSAAIVRSRKLPWWLWGAAAAVLLAVLGMMLALEPIALDIQPAEARVRAPGTLFAFRSGDRLLVLPGEHRVRGEARGFTPAETRVTVGNDGAASVRLRLAKAPGKLDIDTGGVAARVSVDGAEMGRAPGVIELPAGVRTVTLQAPRYLDFVASVQVAGAGERQTLQARMLPNWGTVRVTSEPAKVGIFVDGRPSGSTPAALELPAGVRRLQLAAQGLKTWESSLVVKAGETVAIGPIKLGQPDAKLAVSSTPSGAEVTVGGAFRGRTPVAVELPPGMSHEVSVSLPGHAPWSRKVFAEPAANLDLNARLEAVLARVSVRGQPEGAEIVVDGTVRGTTPRVLDLTTTTHRIEVRKQGFLPYTTNVVPAKGLERAVEYRLSSADRATALAEEVPVIRTKIGYVLRFVPPGTFTMGSERREQGRRPNEGLRQVTLKRPFYMGVTEVTNAQFRRFRPAHASGYIDKQSVDLENHPVTRVSWEDAVEFCNWLSAQEGLPPAYEQRDDRFVLVKPVTNGYRLPTEAEWEYAGRYAGPGRQSRYAWGDRLPVSENVGNLAGVETGETLSARLDGYRDEFPVAAPVAQYAANPLGLHDLTGNVSEWVNDFYLSFVDGMPVVDPLGPAAGNRHTVRGSSWRTALASELRLAWRDTADEASQAVGFRVARYAD